MRNTLFGSICWLVISAPAHAAIESIDHIRATARDFVMHEVVGDDPDIDVSVGKLDPRLRLAQCGQGLQAYFSPGSRTSGHTTVGVRCKGPKSWSLFVPIHIDRQAAVAIATAPIARGQIISAADIAFEKRSTSALNAGFFGTSQELFGMIATRPIQRGHAVAPNMVKAPKLVRRGERVTLSLQTGGVSVRVAGKAMRDGTRGERIPVRNLSSKRVIEGVVHEPGVILIGAAGLK